MEQPHIRVRAVDLALNGELRRLSRALATELCAPWTEPVIAYRRRYRWVQAFDQVRVRDHVMPPNLLRDSGVYLIAGGLGIVGLAIAEFLARTVRARLALMSRAGLPAREHWARWLSERGESDPISRTIRRVQAIESSGAEVMVCKADVTDESQVRHAIAEAEARFGALSGVVHAAAAEKRFVPIRALRRTDCEVQFRPRLAGLRVLHNVLRGKPLDFCLVNSSLASVVGLMDFASYTASQVFMDAFVHRCSREEGALWRVVNWDGWLEDARVETRSPGMPMFYMRSGEAIDALSRIISMENATQVLVSTGDLQGRIDQVLGREMPQADDGAAAKAVRDSQAHPRGNLSSEYEAPRNDIERMLAGIWQQMLGIDRVGIHDNFFELGGDSLLNIQLTATVNRAGVRMTPKQIFEHQTIAELAANVGGTPKAEIGPGDAVKLLGLD
jgi:NAD(P)-dependent dehydrogenase (short-subunit alcohol dehydrogenase family)